MPDVLLMRGFVGAELQLSQSMNQLFNKQTVKFLLLTRSKITDGPPSPMPGAVAGAAAVLLLLCGISLAADGADARR